MNTTAWLTGSVAADLADAKLGDPRRTRRLCEIAQKISEEPRASFPDVFHSSAELEGFYRFVRNENIQWDQVLEPHLAASCRRAEAVGECLAIHDTTEFAFGGEREGLGPISSKGHGYLAHTTLLVGTDEARTPFGVAALEQYARDGQRGPSRVRARRDDENSEGRRWLRNADAVHKRAAGRFDCIHIADREGDSYPFLVGLLDLGARFVIRVAQNRRLEDDFGDPLRLEERLLELRPLTTRNIEITARGKRLNPTVARTHPSRKKRLARVSIAATTVTIPRPGARVEGCHIELQVVRVWEQKPPAGEPPVEWILWTTEPVHSIDGMLRVVDFYRARWVIEEYFKVVKTGCRFEQRQLESFGTLTTALAIFVPVAWKLLLMRSFAHSKPDCSAETVLSSIQRTYLQNKYGKPVRTAHEALMATAKLGGHLRQNGEPGWQTLWRGYAKLLAGEAFVATLQAKTCDQS